ncbi:hypothetical protein GQ55_2G424600 [Panicum hallii var. hallii]|uniref:NB-ARC domain-containing protein n=1 Tax=Panicum hallii var. hallii TaxID=1504633 RepID=A0A2T7EY93_9POAL|nr:hypothetical protein GQ55_2G424600 [Panicum hallii var. hallii]
MEHAVVSAAEGSIHTLLGKLGTILIQQAQLVGGVRGQLQYLKDELESMMAFLQDLSEKDEHRRPVAEDAAKLRQVKIWMKQVREVAYDVEDCIDGFKHHVGNSSNNYGRGSAAFFHRITQLLRTIRVRHQIARQIRELETRATNISDRNSRWLMEEHTQQLRVISLFGFGGLGKTTLAMTAYQSLSATSACFKYQAFATVSQKFDVKVLMSDILRQIIQPCYHPGRVRTGEAPIEDPLKGMENWDVGQLANMLRQQLENKKYLIVLDDIWSISAWEGIRFSLPDSNNGSRILVTTRIKAVAYSCCCHEYDRVYEIEPLTDHESRDLFFKRIFGGAANCPENLKEISAKILRKCGGTPLAIVSIAGLLGSKPGHSIEQWEKVYGSLGSELETSPSLEKLKEILELSYNDLPYQLKTCFLYLSIYPEDHNIRRKSLLRRWIAEHFVTEKRGLSVFEVAESYFDELVNRSIIQPVDVSITGKVKTFRVHDVMLEIIVSKSIEKNFVTLVGDQHTSVPQEKIRRLSVHSGGVVREISTREMLSHVRSLSIFANGEILQFGWMKVVKILDLEGCEFVRNKDLKNVCRLFQLEYLSLRKTRIMELPTKIGNLQKLETLDIRQTSIKHLPHGITNLARLENLLGNLVSLTTLAEIEITDVTSRYISELGKLSQLRKLGVMMFVDDDNSWASLICALENLSSSLCSLLLWQRDGAINFNTLDSLSRTPVFMKSMNFRGRLGKLPKWFPLLSSLAELTLRATELSVEVDLQVLAQLPCLLYLRLHHSAFTSTEFRVSASEFPCLKLLVIQTAVFETLKVRFEEGALPKLDRLELSLFEDASIQELSGIKFLHSLKEVTVCTCPGNSTEDAMRNLMIEAEENLNKPTVTIKAKQWITEESRYRNVQLTSQSA